MKKLIYSKLRAHNISPRLKGYYYMKMAIELAYSNEGYEKGIAARIYRTVASKFDVTASAVQHAIKYALLSAGIKKQAANIFLIA